MIQRVMAALARVVIGATVAWSPELATDAQRIYVANHSSHFDFVAIWAALPQHLRARTRPVAAEDYWSQSRLRRYFARDIFKAVLIRRSPPGAGAEEARQAGQESVARMRRALDEGSSLILFPEGTRGSGETMGPFRSGLYHLCDERPDVDVVPVHLLNLNRVLPKGHMIPLPIVTRVRFGPPFRLDQGEARDAFLERARTAVAELVIS